MCAAWIVKYCRHARKAIIADTHAKQSERLLEVASYCYIEDCNTLNIVCIMSA